MQNAAIVVVGDSITWVGSAASVKAPAGARTIDLGDATLLPGFIDAHVHLAGRELGDPEGDEAAVHDYDQYSAILGVDHAKSTLLDGFTSVRNVGAPNFDDMALRKAINDEPDLGAAHGERRLRDRHHRRPLRRQRASSRGCSTAASRPASPTVPIRCAPPCATW